jgi:predicted TIM-barrel fold metal-dependent hydrolase
VVCFSCSYSIESLPRGVLHAFEMIIDCHNHVGVDLLFYLRGEFPYGQHLSAMVAEGGELGVARWIVFPMVSNLSLDIAALKAGEIRPQGGLEKVPYAFENRRMLHEIFRLFPDLGQRTMPFAMLDPMREIQSQAAELRKLRAEFKIYGLKIQSTIIQSDIKCLAKEGRIFLELAEEWNLPFIIHSSVHPADCWAQARDILDLAEANPKVRFCLAHSCRFDRECLARVNELPNAWFDCSAHCIHCDCAVQDLPLVAPENRRFASDYHRPAQVMADLAAAYPNKFLWGSDSPFYSYVGEYEGGTLALMSSYQKEMATLRAQPAEVVERIAGANTWQFLGLPQPE